MEFTCKNLVILSLVLHAKWMKKEGNIMKRKPQLLSVCRSVITLVETLQKHFKTLRVPQDLIATKNCMNAIFQFSFKKFIKRIRDIYFL